MTFSSPFLLNSQIFLRKKEHISFTARGTREPRKNKRKKLANFLSLFVLIKFPHFLSFINVSVCTLSAILSFLLVPRQNSDSVAKVVVAAVVKVFNLLSSLSNDNISNKAAATSKYITRCICLHHVIKTFRVHHVPQQRDRVTHAQAGFGQEGETKFCFYLLFIYLISYLFISYIYSRCRNSRKYAFRGEYFSHDSQNGLSRFTNNTKSQSQSHENNVGPLCDCSTSWRPANLCENSFAVLCNKLCKILDVLVNVLCGKTHFPFGRTIFFFHFISRALQNVREQSFGQSKRANNIMPYVFIYNSAYMSILF